MRDYWGRRCKGEQRYRKILLRRDALDSSITDGRYTGEPMDFEYSDNYALFDEIGLSDQLCSNKPMLLRTV